MNRIEQRLHDAAPAVGAAQRTDPEAELAVLRAAAPGPEQLLPGRANDAGKARFRAGRDAPDGARRRPAILLLLLSLLAAGTWLLTPGRAPEVSGAPAAGPGAAAGTGLGDAAQPAPAEAPSSWRTVTLTRPWSPPESDLAAVVELPFGWTVRRHDASTEFPGLHTSILDQDLLPVAMLYFGPAPANVATSRRCSLASRGGEELDRRDIATGAELLDPALAAAFSFTVSAGPEPRGTFGLVQAAPDGVPCDPGTRAVPAGGLVLRFGDELMLRSAADGPGPRSGYGRTFASRDDAHRYLKSVEYATFRRMMTSLRFTLPAETSDIWHVVPSRPARLG